MNATPWWACCIGQCDVENCPFAIERAPRGPWIDEERLAFIDKEQDKAMGIAGAAPRATDRKPETFASGQLPTPKGVS